MKESPRASDLSWACRFWSQKTHVTLARAWGDEDCPPLSLTAPRLRTPFTAGAVCLDRPSPSCFLSEDIGSVLKGGAKVCQRQLVNEVLGPLVTEFALNLCREGATPIQRGVNASLLGRVQGVKLIRHNALRQMSNTLSANLLIKPCIAARLNGSLSRCTKTKSREPMSESYSSFAMRQPSAL